MSFIFEISVFCSLWSYMYMRFAGNFVSLYIGVIQLIANLVRQRRIRYHKINLFSPIIPAIKTSGVWVLDMC